MRNAGLEEAHAELKFAGRNINNLSYADDTTLMAESEEELKSLIWSHHFMVKRWGNSGTSVRLSFLGSKTTADGDCSHERERRLLLGRKAMTHLDSVLKGRDITLPTKVHMSNLSFPNSHHVCMGELDHKES